MGSFLTDSTFNFDFASSCAREDKRKCNTMYFTPEVEDEVIRDAVSHRLYVLLVNTANKVCRESKQTPNPNSTF